MAEPLLAEVINPRLAQNRREAGEGLATPILPDRPASAPRFGKPLSPEEILRRRQLLAEFLRQRGTPPQ